MILKSLHLENIRSYKDQVIEFPPGTTLFEGDIGSGKSTLLIAIEFALFGLGSEKGGALLRTGEKQGSVDLKFEIDGEEYEIHRSLIRKGKAVQQEEGYIKTKEGIIHLSPSELKERVLEILNFNEPPDPKAQSVIYRYAVFTPQEEMKAILWMRPDARLQTLRKAFRIEDYRIALENATTLVKIIDDKIKTLSTLAADLETKISDKEEREEKIQGDEKSLKQLDKDKTGLEGELRKHKENLAELRNQKEKLSQAVGEVPHLVKEIKEKTGEIAELKEKIEKLSKELEEELQPTIEKLREIKKPTTRTEEELKKELEELRKLDKKLRKIGATIDAKITDYESIEKNKVCPTCDRPADPKEFKGKIEQKLQEKKKAEAEINNCEEKIREIEGLQEKLRDYVRAQEKLQELNRQAGKNREEIEKNKGKITILTGQVEKAKKRLAIAEKDIEELKKISAKVEELDKKVEEVEKALEEIKENISSTNERIRQLKKQVDELDKEIKQKEEQRKQAEKLQEYYIWLQEFFIPTIDNIEKHVMITINQEFNQHFQKWFSMLVDDPGKEARINEEFTPIIEQDGYEQDIYYLSGGEKTSIALAYRLALNSIVQKVSIGMKSNLLILDEPTDGFSKEQLFKVREILNELRCPQVIIVSHEKELESFADQVFKVEKIQGNSKITI